MEIKRAGSQPSGKGPAEWFTGTSALTHSFRPRNRHALRGTGSPLAGCPHRMAYASTRADFNRHVRLRVGTALLGRGY